MLYRPFSTVSLILPRKSRNAPACATSFFSSTIRPARSVTNSRVVSPGGDVANVGFANVPTVCSWAGAGGGGGPGGGGGGGVYTDLNQSAQPASRHSRGSAYFTSPPRPGSPRLLRDATCPAAAPRCVRSR